MRDTMELLRQILAVGVDAAEMNAKLDETVERMESRNTIRCVWSDETVGVDAAIEHRVTLRRAAATGATAGIERYPYWLKQPFFIIKLFQLLEIA